jgi:hypothetical protein
MRTAITVLALVLATGAMAKDRATFLPGQYATKSDCEKLRKIEAGTPKNVENAPELLDAEGFHGWESECEFTKVFEHEAGKSWLGLMVCFAGASMTPNMYVFTKSETDDTFEVSDQNQDMPETYVRCDAGKGQ